MNKVIVAVDPGEDGFITVFDGKGYEFYPMPKKKRYTGKKTKTGKPMFVWDYDPYPLVEIMLKIRKDNRGAEFIPVIEDVHAMYGSSAESTFNFGENVGTQIMALHLLSEDLIKVAPKKWQSVTWKGYNIIKKPSGTGKTMVNDTKATSIMVAKDLFPEIDLRKNENCRVEDDNKVDSLLIAYYAKLKFYD